MAGPKGNNFLEGSTATLEEVRTNQRPKDQMVTKLGKYIISQLGLLFQIICGRTIGHPKRLLRKLDDMTAHYEACSMRSVVVYGGASHDDVIVPKCVV